MTYSKPLVQSRTALAAFLILVLNAAALVFASATVDAGPLVDAIAGGAWTEAISAALSLAVIFFRAGAVERIRGLFSPLAASR